MKKPILILALLSFHLILSAQFVHIGAGVGALRFNLQANVENAIMYFYPNLENEIIQLENFEPDNSFKLNLSVYGIYEARQNYFVRAEVSGFSTVNTIRYVNSVDQLSYIASFDENKKGYDQMDFRYWFMSSTIDVGYRFLSTKLIRPYAFAGVGGLALLSLSADQTYQDGRSIRNSFIESEVRSLYRFSARYNAGVGVKYHGLAAEIFYSGSMGAIDSYGDLGIYDSYAMFGALLRLDLFTINLSPKTAKEKVKQLQKFN